MCDKAAETSHPAHHILLKHDGQQSQFVSAVRDFANDHDFILISQSKTVQQSGSRLYTFSVFISSNTQNILFEPLTLMGTPIVDKALMQKVAAGDIDSYAGYGNDAFKQIYLKLLIKIQIGYKNN